METVSEVCTERVSASAIKERKQTKPVMTRIWNFLISLKFAIWIIILLAATSILGTVIQQNQPMEKYLQEYSKGTIRVLETLQLFDMYHSWWFLFLLSLFALNLTCCTIDRLPRAIRTVRNPRRTIDTAMEKSLSLAERWKNKGNIQKWAETYRSALSGAFAAPKITEHDGSVHLYAEKGAWSRFGAYATHAGIIIVFVGAIVGNVFGFKSYVNIPEGKEASHLDARGGEEHIDLPFSVRNNKFWVETYPNGQAKEYSSDLSVIENGREVLRKTIEVNDPLVYKGIWFYQSSYGQAGPPTVLLSVRKASGEDAGILPLGPNKKAEIPGYGTVRAVKFEPNFEGFGPALQVIVEKPGKAPQQFWLLQRFPDFDRKRGDAFTLGFLDIKENFYTGLQVAKDPGVNVVWLGCLLLTAGMMISFFVSHRRIWIRLSPDPHGKAEVTLAGSANRNRQAFEKTFAAVLAAIRQDPSKTDKENPA
jgi:cytochrome c biogenesis protein